MAHKAMRLYHNPNNTRAENNTERALTPLFSDCQPHCPRALTLDVIHLVINHYHHKVKAQFKIKLNHWKTSLAKHTQGQFHLNALILMMKKWVACFPEATVQTPQDAIGHFIQHAHHTRKYILTRKHDTVCLDIYYLILLHTPRVEAPFNSHLHQLFLQTKQSIHSAKPTAKCQKSLLHDTCLITLSTLLSVWMTYHAFITLIEAPSTL